MIDKEKIRNYKKGNAIFWTVLPILIVIIISFLVYLFAGGFNSDCDDCFHLEGYLSSIKNNGTFIVVNSHDYYISDWFRIDGIMPYYINSYVGNNVSIDYMAGCGRRYITSFELVN